MFVLRVLSSSYVYLFISFVFVVPYVYLLYYVRIAVLTLDAGLLARSQYPEGPATGHLDTGFFLVSPCLQANAEMVLQFPSCYYEGHLESKERFAIKKYLLIIGKKKNMQVLSHTFTYFST